MTKFTRFKMLLLALVMLVGSGNVLGQTEQVIYTTGFESAQGFTATTAYNNAAVKYQGPTGQQWGIIMGTTTTTDFITTAQSMQMRSYASNTNLGSIVTNFDLAKVTKVTFKAKSSNVSNTPSFKAYYSTNGGSTWSTATTITVTTSAVEYTYNISATGEFASVRIKIEHPTINVASRLTIDDVTVYGMVGSTPTVATPELSPSTGTYYSTQNVSISTATEGATIYYTTDGSDPDNTDTEYASPIAVSSTTTIKAIAYKTDMDPSAVATAVYTFPTINDVSNIAALRAGTTGGTVYKLTGEAVLTLKTATRNAKYIQDATGGILIDDATSKITTTYNVGDGITGIIGTLTPYNGMLQFVPVADPGAATTTGNTVTPVEVDLADLADYPAQLVKVSGVTITGTGNFAKTNYNLNGTDTTVLRPAYDDLPYIGQPIPTVPQDIVGVVLISLATEQLVPRTIDDFSNTVFSTPTIIVSEATVPAMTAQVGATDTETITVSGQNLSANIGLSVTGTNASLFTLSTYSIVPVSETVTDVVVTITYTPTAAGSHTALLTLTSTGAAEKTRTLSGTATWPPLATPVAENAGAVSQTGFTAIWGAVSGATSYELSVYTKEESGGNATDLFISEYGEGSSGNKKYIEIFNGTGADVDLSAYVIKKAVNGAGWNATVYTFPASTVLTNSSTFVLANNITDVLGADIYDGFCTWNGDDAIGLFKNNILIDVFGVPDTDPGSGWSVAGVSNATVDHVLIRKSSVTAPNTDWVASAGTTTENSEWEVSSFTYSTTDQTVNLGSHTFAGGGSSTTQISGSPFTVTGETSKAITGLSASTTYYYTVVAKNVNVDSDTSNEISVETSFGTGIDAPVLKNITAFDGKICFSATAGQVVEVYNAVGQKLMSSTTHDGLNTLPVDARGMMIVKLGNQVAKVIL
jgi:hypothetical protein